MTLVVKDVESAMAYPTWLVCRAAKLNQLANMTLNSAQKKQKWNHDEKVRSRLRLATDDHNFVNRSLLTTSVTERIETLQYSKPMSEGLYLYRIISIAPKRLTYNRLKLEIE